jgi:hypothetical protein
MSKRPTPTMTVLVCLLLTALALGTAACGSAGGTTTTAAPATVTTGSVTVPSVPTTPEVQTYINQMRAWSATMAKITPADAANDPLKIADVSKVTDAQVSTAETMATQAHAALDELKAIIPPASLAAFQQMLVSLISSAVDETDKMVAALKNRDQSALDAARAQGDRLEAQLTSLMETLAPLLMGGTATS